MTYPDRRLTLRDVATAAGVSEMTVSRVLRGTGVVSERTRDRVQAVIDDLGYVPNRLAGSLARSRSNQVAVIIPSLRNNVFTEVMSGITDALERAGYSPVVGVSDYDLDKEETLVASMMSWRPAGILMPNNQHNDRTRSILKSANIPVVQMMSLTDDPIWVSVGLDQAAAGQALATHLIAQGYQTFGFVGWHKGDCSGQLRLAAMSDLIRAHGRRIVPPVLMDGHANFSSGKAGLAALLDTNPEVDIVLFPNDMVAIGGYIHCIETGMSCPDDLAIAGFSGLASGQSMPKRLTSVETRRYDIGHIAARSVLNALAGQKVRPQIDLGFKLIAGETA